MLLIDQLLESVRALDCPIRRAFIGPRWIIVESRFTGIAHRFESDTRSGLEAADDYTGRSAFELAEILRSDNLFRSSLGAAALNSLLEPTGRIGNIFRDIFSMIRGKTVTMVGRFPINKEIDKVAGQLYVLELEPEEGELPAEACDDVIPQSEIVMISGSSLINKTLPGLLELCTKAKARVFVIGPSTPMSDVLISHGAYMLGGVRVADTDALIESVRQGAGSSKELVGVEAIIKP